MRPVFLQLLSDKIIKAIGWTLIHSLWQGLLAAIIAGGIILCTKKSTARLRYNLLGIVFILFIVTVLITAAGQLETHGTATTGIVGLKNLHEETSFVVVNHSEIITPALTTFDKFVDYFNANADLFVLIWAVFFLVHCLKLAGGLAGVNRVRNYRTHAVSEEWVHKLDHFTRLVGVQQTVKLLQSELVKVPVAIGFFKPVILLPLGLLANLPAEQVETILIHELAHVRRKDYLVNILQRIVEAVFFFNPALMWISSLLRQEREACCDDMVVANSNYKGNYLEALVSFQEYSLTTGKYAMGISSKRHHLLHRVKRMITNENKKLNIMEKIVLVAGLLAFTAFNFIPKNEPATSDEKPGVISNNIPALRPGLPPTINLSHPTIQQPTRHVTHHQSLPVAQPEGEAILDVSVTAPPRDTVPDKTKNKANYDDLKFPSISSSINDDGKNKTENTTVTDQDGKKYSYTKENDKLTKLTVNGKNIPESEFGNYAPLLDRIQMTMDENRERRMQAVALRKVERAIQAQEMRNRVADRRLEQQYEGVQRLYLLKQGQLMNQSRRLYRSSEDQKRQMLLLMQKLQQQQLKPRLNGREVIRIDNKLDTKNTILLSKAPDLKLRTKLVLATDIKKCDEVRSIITKRIGNRIDINGVEVLKNDRLQKPRPAQLIKKRREVI